MESGRRGGEWEEGWRVGGGVESGKRSRKWEVWRVGGGVESGKRGGEWEVWRVGGGVESGRRGGIESGKGIDQTDLNNCYMQVQRNAPETVECHKA